MTFLIFRRRVARSPNGACPVDHLETVEADSEEDALAYAERTFELSPGWEFDIQEEFEL